MVRKWEAMYYLRKFGGLSVFALVVAVPSLAFANSVLTSQTYVDAKVQAQGSTTGSILSASSPDDKAPSSKAVYTALQGIDGATPYTGTGLIDVTGHTISTTAEQNVQADWDEATTTSDAYIANKPTIVNAATDITGATSADTKELPTTYAVQQYVTTAAAASNFVEDSITDGVTTKAPSENAVHDALELKYDASNPSGYQANVIEGITVGGTEQTPTNKVVALGSAAGKDSTTDTTLAASGETGKLPTAATVKTYVDSQSASAASGILTQSITDADTTHAPSGDAVNDALVNKQTKPASGVASGKVLTYTGTDANANVSASYITVPVANNDPNAATNPGTVSSLASIWVQ